MAPRTRAAEHASKLDPTALEQSGLDPQQVRKEIEAAVRQATAQTQNTSSSPPSASATSSPRSPEPSTTSADGSSTRRPGPWNLDTTYLEQTGLDPEQVRREIEAAVRQTRSSSSAPSQAGNAQPSGDSKRKPSVVDAVRSLDPAVADPSAVENYYKTLENIQLSEWKSGGPPRQDAPQPHIPADYLLRDPPDFSKSLDTSALVRALRKLSDEPPPTPHIPIDYLLDQKMLNQRMSPPSTTSAPHIPIDYLLDQRNLVNVVNRLSVAFDTLKNQLESVISQYSDVLSYDPNTGRIDANPRLQGLVDEYRRALDELRREMPSIEGMLMTGLGGNVFVWDADAGSPDLVLPPDQLKQVVEQMRNAKIFVTRQDGGVNIELAPDFEATVQDVNKLFDELNNANEDYHKSVQNVIDEFNESSGGRFKLKINDDGEVVIDETIHKQGFEKVDELNREYDAKLQELIQKYGAVVAEDGRILMDPSKLNAFRADLSALHAWYVSELDKILEEHGLKIEGDKIVVDVSIYSDAFSKLNEIGQRHNKRLQDIYSSFGHLLVATTDEQGRTVYTLKPDAVSDVALYNIFANTVNAYGAAVQQTIQNIVNKYGGVLTYDQNTGQIRPSKELEDMLSRYTQATQEVNRLTGFMSAVAGMFQTTAQQLPALNIEFMTYDADKKSFVLGSKTPIYIEDPEKRRELLDWLKRQGVDKQGKPNVGVAAFVDPRYNLPVAYIYNKETGEGYFINYTVGQVQYMPDAKQYAESHMQSIWFSSLSPKELEQYIQSQQLEHFKQTSKREFEKLPPVIREIVGTLVTAGKYVFVPDVLTLKGALVGDKDPLFKAKKFHAMVEGIGEVSPITSHAGTALGIGTIVGGAAASILARGAAKLAVQGAKAAAKDTAKLTAVKKPELTAASTARPLQQVVKQPTLLQTAVVGLKNAAVPMTISGAVFGGLEGAKSYIETGKIDASRVLEGAAFGSLMGAFPITKKQALAALGIGAGATAGAGLVRGYDLATSLAVGEAAGLTAVVGGGVKGLSEAGVKADAKIPAGVKAGTKTPGVRAPEVKITDFAIVVEPREKRLRTVSAEYLAEVARARPLSNLIDGIVKDVITGKLSVGDANLQLGIIRDTIWDKKLVDELLQSSIKKLVKFPKTQTMDFATAANKAAEVIYAADSGKLSKHKAFIELADLRISVVDKAGFDKLFNKKLKEYGEHYIQWLLNSGRDKSLTALDLHRYENVLGRQLIKKYMPEYEGVLAEVKNKLSHLRPVNPRDVPLLKLTPEKLSDMVETTFRDVLDGKKDFFKASEELYWLWNRLSPDMRPKFETILNDLNAYYGKKYGITLEPWRPSLLESILRRAELSAADVGSVLANASKATAELIRSKIKAAEELLSPGHLANRWKGWRIMALDDKLRGIAESFKSGKIGLEEAKKALAELARKYEKLGMPETAKMIRDQLKDSETLKKFLDNVSKIPSDHTMLGSMQETAGLRLGRAKDAATGMVKAAEELLSPGHLANRWKGHRMIEIESKFFDLLDRFRSDKISLEDTRRKVSKLINKIEKMFGRKTAEMYRKYFELAVLDKEFRDVIKKFKRGEIKPEETKKRLMEIADNIEKIRGKKKADLYREYAEEVLTWKHTESTRTEEGSRLPNENASKMNGKTMNGKTMTQAGLSKRGFEFGTRLGEISRKDAERQSVQMMKERGVEGRGQQLLVLERPIEKYIEEVLPGKHRGPRLYRRAIDQLETVQLEKPKPLYKVLEEVEVPKRRRRRRRIILPFLPSLEPEIPPQDTRTWIRIPELPEDIPKHIPPFLTTTVTPLAVDVPPSPTYTPLAVPQLTTYDVPTYYVPTVSTSDVPTYYVPTEPAYYVPTEPLPYGWWRFLPPGIFFGDRTGTGDGAYKVQEGKKQILALA